MPQRCGADRSPRLPNGRTAAAAAAPAPPAAAAAAPPSFPEHTERGGRSAVEWPRAPPLEQQLWQPHQHQTASSARPWPEPRPKPRPRRWRPLAERRRSRPRVRPLRIGLFPCASLGDEPCAQARRLGRRRARRRSLAREPARRAHCQRERRRHRRRFSSSLSDDRLRKPRLGSHRAMVVAADTHPTPTSRAAAAAGRDSGAARGSEHSSVGQLAPPPHQAGATQGRAAPAASGHRASRRAAWCAWRWRRRWRRQRGERRRGGGEWSGDRLADHTNAHCPDHWHGRQRGRGQHWR